MAYLKCSFTAPTNISSSQSSPSAATSTIKITPGCPSAAPADVMVTRSAVAVPSCEAGNATKPMIVSMSPTMSMGMGGGGATGSPTPSQFTGAASRYGLEGSLAVVIGGAVLGLLI